MIEFPDINFKSMKVQIIFFSLLWLVFIMKNMDISTLVSIIVVVVLITHSSNALDTINKKVFEKDDKEKYNYNNQIEIILKELETYKEGNEVIYRQSMYYWSHFIKNIKLLEDETLYNYNHYFDRAFMYLQKSSNSFLTLGTSMSERIFVDGLKHNDFTNSKELMNISRLTKNLYKEGYLLLYNLSLRLNKKWKDNPHIYNKEIVLEHPLPYDKLNKGSYDFYI